MAPSLTSQALKLGLELLIVLVGGSIVVAVGRRLRPEASFAQLAAAALATATAALAIYHVPPAVRRLHQAERIRVGVRRGVDYCFEEDGVQGESAFVEWVQRRVPAGAVYQLDDLLPEPDAWCLTLALLPSLPAGPGDTHPAWEIAFGGYTPAIAALVAHHSPRVRVFAPHFALANLAGAP